MLIPVPIIGWICYQLEHIEEHLVVLSMRDDEGNVYEKRLQF